MFKETDFASVHHIQLILDDTQKFSYFLTFIDLF